MWKSALIWEGKAWFSWTCWCIHEVVILYANFLHDVVFLFLKLVGLFTCCWICSDFLASQDIMINRSNHATSKICNCGDGPIPTCMLENKTTMLSICWSCYFTWKCFTIKMLEAIGWKLRQCREALFCFGRTAITWSCALMWDRHVYLHVREWCCLVAYLCSCMHWIVCSF